MTNTPHSRPVMPRPSAALVLLRDREKGGAGGSEGGGVEVFMVRRHVASEFVPDVFVFPGGSVKPEDSEAELAAGLCVPVAPGPTVLGSGLRVAALRECFEEAGVLLARRGGQAGEGPADETAPSQIGPQDAARFAGYRDDLQHKRATLREIAEREHLTLATDELLLWAHWITPEAMPKRFDTYFFLAAMPEGQQAAHDQLEVTDSAWVTPEEALRGFEADTFPLVFATIEQLHSLTGLANTQAARERFAGTTPRTVMPTIVVREGTRVIILPEEK